MLYSFREIPGGRAGTDATLREIGKLISDSQARPVVRLSALNILEQNNVKPSNSAAAIAALFAWTRRNVQYIQDPLEVETVQAPEVTLQIKAGDCDDHATLMASFAANLGIPARLVTIGYDPDAMVHIFPEVLIGGRWTATDTTQAKPLGFQPTLPVRKIYDLKGKQMPALGTAQQVYPITVDDLQTRVYTAAYNQLRLNWQRALINRGDVASYLRVIDEGNAPLRNTVAEQPMRQAIVDFLAKIDATGAQSGKPAQGLTGLEGMNGFLSSIVSAVKAVVSVIPGVGTIAGSAFDLLSKIGISVPSGGSPADKQAVFIKIEQAINGPTPVDLPTLLAAGIAAGFDMGWLAVTNKNSFLKPATLPMYWKPKNSLTVLSMDATAFTPYAGTPQTVDGGALAVADINRLFGSNSSIATADQFYKTIAANATGSTATGGLFDFSQTTGLFSNPLVLIGGSILVFLLLRKRRA